MARKGNSANDVVIKNAFARLSQAKDVHIEHVMHEVLAVALEALLTAHDNHPIAHRHPEEDDTLAWALIHNGKVVEAVAHSGGRMTAASALRTLRRVMAENPSKGWYGVVCSDVTNNWYRIDWEMSFLNASMNAVKANIQQYLKKI